MMLIAIACVSKVVDNRPAMDQVVGNIVEVMHPQLNINR